MGRKMKNTRMDLTQGPIMKNLIIFSLPILAGSILTELHQVVDSMVAGKYISSDALAAISAAQPVTMVINMFMIGLSTGSNVVVAQRTGTKSHEQLQNAISTTAVLTLIIGVLITVLGFLFGGPLLRLMGTPDNVYDDAMAYLSVVFIGTIGNLMYQMGSGALRGMGDSVWPFMFLCVCSVIHIILDIIAVPVLRLGVWSVAAATAISQTISGVGLIWRINKGKYGVKLTTKTLEINKEEAKQIAIIGLPAAIQHIGNNVASIFVQSAVNGFGSVFMSANSVVTRLESFSQMPIMAVSTSITTFVAQNIGLHKMDRIKKGINMSMLILVLFGSLCCVGMILTNDFLPTLFVDEPEVIEIAAKGVVVLAFVCTFHGIDRVLVQAMRGAGKSVVPMITAQFSAFTRIPLAYLLAVRTGDYMGIFYSMLLAAFARTAAIAVYYFCGGWKKTIRDYERKHPLVPQDDATIEKA